MTLYILTQIRMQMVLLLTILTSKAFQKCIASNADIVAVDKIFLNRKSVSLLVLRKIGRR